MVVDIFRDKGVASCTVRMERERVQRAFEQAYGEAAQNIKIPGFRRGKAPLNVLRSRLNEGQIRSRVLEMLVPEGIKECLERYSLKPMTRPTLEDYSLQEGSEFVFQVSLVERPKLELGECKGLQASLPEMPDTKQRAQEILERFRRTDARMKPKDGEVEEQDVVEARLEFWEDGEQRMVRERVRLDLGEESLDPALRSGLLGSKTGEEREFEKGSGGSGRYKVEIQSVFRKEVPELTPEWVKSKSGRESVEALMAELEDQEAKRAREEAEKEVREALLREACARAQTEVPVYSTIRLASSRLAAFVEELRTSGFSLEGKGAEGPGAVDQVFADILEKSREAIKERLVVQEIAEKEGITVSDEEVAAAVEAMHPELKEDDREREALLSRTEAELLRNRVIDFLYVNALVSTPEQAAGSVQPSASASGEAGESGGEG